MIKNIIAPILLLINGLFNLFPGTIKPYVSWGYQPVTFQTIIGFISIILAIGIISAIKFKSPHEEKV